MEPNRAFQTFASVFACVVLLPCLAITMVPLLLLGAPVFLGMLLPLAGMAAGDSR